MERGERFWGLWVSRVERKWEKILVISFGRLKIGWEVLGILGIIESKGCWRSF